ncbi:ABC transporter ATP-binding protein [Pseudomonas syringae]|uniref:ATP-binding cassette domain-containing protein n=2 Tax=Pseudomonas syringae group TaxID=136849 RepID=A0A9Q4A143_PSESX|nr:ABC transporter ATP-binding protein [Pseudomonas syringae]KTB61682.1 ABC transporter ATP-binding protein [Pseudomonas viridiflava ICMP 13104]MCF5468469.1 ATP-binding cassette domain-containing protein [Pseudomonas syringae]MCF5474917.1 ATP-binding cassette domain-containing protein [Pseudomonas syringae]MCF5484861.1 ATP-binding cassette domain-containing protein [Pseudomonas syringae]MCF5489137.1 ATP-binding cassette domain-containing protein [Pseudomonas syringae]
MSNVVIKAEHLTKQFVLRHNRGGLKQKFLSLFEARHRERIENFTAVSDVSFTLCKGESLALVGHNGSGKSTLLQLVSRILIPTSGRLTTVGRVAPLIEIGVGFHPELTGEENIYLNASLFGLNNKEIRSRFNEIVDFSGLGNFIDTPVKNYSSGMYMRLGFSVAVHVEPQTLLADEVLAVGDEEFKRKCHERIRCMQEDGMALILVTHEVKEGMEFCQRYLTLERGQMIEHGSY